MERDFHQFVCQFDGRRGAKKEIVPLVLSTKHGGKT
ncbi:WD_REPEATS_REGION domain-containing protein [Psidium guajava]|nr:WD_REPEATS_REGION domain-containing protein [Psidium guajava]